MPVIGGEFRQSNLKPQNGGTLTPDEHEENEHKIAKSAREHDVLSKPLPEHA